MRLLEVLSLAVCIRKRTRLFFVFLFLIGGFFEFSRSRFKSAIKLLIICHEDLLQTLLQVLTEEDFWTIFIFLLRRLLLQRLYQDHFLVVGQIRTISALRAADLVHLAALRSRWDYKGLRQIFESFGNLSDREVRALPIWHGFNVAEEAANKSVRVWLLESLTVLLHPVGEHREMSLDVWTMRFQQPLVNISQSLSNRRFCCSVCLFRAFMRLKSRGSVQDVVLSFLDNSLFKLILGFLLSSLLGFFSIARA